jgi:hypothetical protein
MSRIWQLLESLRSLLFSLASNIEQSSYYERLMARFEGLDLSAQKRVKLGLAWASVLSIGLFLVWPMLSVFGTRIELSRANQLLNDLSGFNNAYSVEKRMAPHPAGWVSLPLTSTADIESSMNQFLAKIGVPADLATIVVAQNNVSIKVAELSLRQLVPLVFQLDAWFPALQFDKLKVRVNEQRKDLLDAELELTFDTEGALKFQSVPTADSMARSNEGSSFRPPAPGDSNGGFDEPPPPTPPGFSNESNYIPPPPPPPGSIGNDRDDDLPPPPPFDEDL